MSGRVLQTKRLKLRPLKAADAPAIARLIGNWNVIRWLTSPPWPYRLADAQWFVADDGSSGSFCIEIDGAFAGIVGLTNKLDLGYWLGQPFHGQGYMTEAARAVVDSHFSDHAERLMSGYIPGNETSAGVLKKCGFVNTETISVPSVPLGRDVQVQRMELTSDMWRACHG